MVIKVITVSSSNASTGNFTIQFETVQKVLLGDVNALLVVDDTLKDDPLAHGQMIKGPELWKTVGGAVSNGFMRAGDSIVFLAKRPEPSENKV